MGYGDAKYPPPGLMPPGWGGIIIISDPGPAGPYWLPPIPPGPPPHMLSPAMEPGRLGWLGEGKYGLDPIPMPIPVGEGRSDWREDCSRRFRDEWLGPSGDESRQ